MTTSLRTAVTPGEALKETLPQSLAQESADLTRTTDIIIQTFYEVKQLADDVIILKLMVR